MSMSQIPEPLPFVNRITPYLPGDSEAACAHKIVKLSSNESPLGPSPHVKEALRPDLLEFAHYPDTNAASVRHALAHLEDLDPDRIVCGAGSEQLLTLIARTFAGPNHEVLHSQYAFAAYSIAADSCGATPIWAHEEDYRTQVDALLSKVTPRTRVLFLANPNNPTGTYLPSCEIRRLRDDLPSDVLLVLDAAYAEYVTESDYDPGLELVDQVGRNTVVTRTFSKIHGLAALRFGWAYCPPHVANALRKMKDVFGVSTVAQIAAEASLTDPEHLQRSLEHNCTWRPWLARAFADRGYETVPGVANFLLLKLRSADEAARLDLHFRSTGLIVRSLCEYGLSDCLRITVGLEEDNRKLIKRIDQFDRR